MLYLCCINALTRDTKYTNINTITVESPKADTPLQPHNTIATT